MLFSSHYSELPLRKIIMRRRARSICQPSLSLTQLYRATLHGTCTQGVHHDVMEVDGLGFYLYVFSERCDGCEYESSLRSRYGEYPVFLGKTQREAQGWIMEQGAPLSTL
jgi:hypothetical protein